MGGHHEKDHVVDHILVGEPFTVFCGRLAEGGE
ncbi:Uncharacterised protein [Mycobacteroides abscessus subsp. abscessus]|nr:Uncharacterised protein [Mycobacteroides abscessus subsp. abscessus]